MRLLLAASHRYPAFNEHGSGIAPREYPSGSAYHLHDLLARGLAEEGHEVFYYVKKGTEIPMPPGVEFVSRPIPDVELCHAVMVPPLALEASEFAAQHRKPCLLTCHLDVRVRGMDPSVAGPNWVFVSRTLAQAHGSKRFVLNGLSPSDYIFSETKEDYFLFMGAMDRAEDKGLLHALALSKKKGFRLMVAGTAQKHEAIEKVAEWCNQYGAAYMGDVRGEKKAELLAGARALLFPSRMNEGCPLVILEAMMSGTPVISSACGGSPDVMLPEAGFLCETDEQWERAVDEVDRISSRRCREIAVERFHYRRMVRDYLREYELEIKGYQG